MDVEPFDTIKVNVSNYDPRDREISILKAEKAQLVVDLLKIKGQNNDLFLRGQEFQRKENLSSNEIRSLQEQNKLYAKQDSDQRLIIADLKSSNETLASLVTDLQKQIKNFSQTLLPSSDDLIDEEEESELNVNRSLTNTSQVKIEPNVGEVEYQENSMRKRKANDKASSEPKEKKEKNEVNASFDHSEFEAKKSKGKNEPAVEKQKSKRQRRAKIPKEPETKKGKEDSKANIGPIDLKAQILKGTNEPAVEKPKAKQQARGKAPKEPKTKKEKQSKAKIELIDKTYLETQELNGKDNPAVKKLPEKRSCRKKNTT